MDENAKLIPFKDLHLTAIDYECLRKDTTEKEYAHDYLFHSILGLLEIKTTAYDKEFDLFKIVELANKGTKNAAYLLHFFSLFL